MNPSSRILIILLAVSIAVPSYAEKKKLFGCIPYNISLKKFLIAFTVVGVSASVAGRYVTQEARRKAAEEGLSEMAKKGDVKAIRAALAELPRKVVLDRVYFESVMQGWQQSAEVLNTEGKARLDPTKYDVQSLMVQAIQDGDLARVKYLVENGASVHYSLGEPVSDALMNDQVEIALYLLDQGANYKYYNGAILREALWEGDARLIERVLKLDIDHVGEKGETLITAYQKNKDVYQRLLKMIPDQDMEILGRIIFQRDPERYAVVEDLIHKAQRNGKKLDLAALIDIAFLNALYTETPEILKNDVGYYIWRDARGQSGNDDYNIQFFMDHVGLKDRRVDVALALTKEDKNPEGVRFLLNRGASKTAALEIRQKMDLFFKEKLRENARRLGLPE